MSIIPAPVTKVINHQSSTESRETALPSSEVVKSRLELAVERRNAFRQGIVPEPSSVPAEPAVNHVVKSKTEEIAERRAAFKHAADVERRAMAMKKQTDQQIQEVKQFQNFMEQAKTDPTAVAKAMGMDPAVFLKKYQDKILDMPTEPEVRPEDEVKRRLDKYEQERQMELQAKYQERVIATKQNYIASKILPVITADTEKFQLLNLEGRENCAGFIYDIMDAHYQKTGEELSASDVAEAMESNLTKEIEDKMARIRKLNKFSKHFVPEISEEVAPTQQLSATKHMSAPSSDQDILAQKKAAAKAHLGLAASDNFHKADVNTDSFNNRQKQMTSEQIRLAKMERLKAKFGI